MLRRYDWKGAALIVSPYVLLVLVILALIVVAMFTVPSPGELR